MPAAIPGGSAEFVVHPPRALARRLKRACEAEAPLLARVAQASEVSVAGDVRYGRSAGLDRPPVDLTDAEHDRLQQLNDLGVVTHLRGWTLDRPLPRTVDEVRALPADLRDALKRHAARLMVNSGG